MTGQDAVVSFSMATKQKQNGGVKSSLHSQECFSFYINKGTKRLKENI
jgi:hypothetical protein